MVLDNRDVQSLTIEQLKYISKVVLLRVSQLHTSIVEQIVRPYKSWSEIQ